MKNKLIIKYFLFLILGFQLAAYPQSELKSFMPEPVRAAYGVLTRVIPTKANDFNLILTGNKNVNDKFEVEASNGKVTVKGNSAIALTRGIYYYLRHADNSMITWNGSHINLPKILPDFPNTIIESPYKYRLYYNVCAFGYTTVFWDWKKWQKEIDWMALHGINMPLAMVGQEAVWQKVWNKIGITNKELSEYFTGPAFLPWNRMGNINKYAGPLPESYIKKSEVLQKKILRRMRELGMHPIVPAFSGYVPKALKHIYPDANIIAMKSWDEFPPSDGTYMLSPLSKQFSQLGKMFIREYQKVYGHFHFYLADAFNEMVVPVTPKDKYKELSEFGKAIYHSIKAGDPNGVWVMQGWLFHNKQAFWTKPAVKAFLKDVPDDKMIIIDLANELFHGWKKFDGFYGKEWIYSIIHDFGGRNLWFGNLPFYSNNPVKMLADSAHGNLVGFGISPEGIDNNEVVYELLTDMAWKHNPVNLKRWIAKYCLARYGADPQKMKEAWNYLLKSMYSTNKRAPLYFYQERPQIIKYNNWLSSKNFNNATKLFLSCSKLLNGSDLYKDDAIQIAAQYTGNKVDFLLSKAIGFYKQNDHAKMKIAFKDAFKLMNKIDELLYNHPLYRLQNWIQMARKWGVSPKQSDYYETDAKLQITIWGGPHLSEYAAKEWSGLIKYYYLQRWKRFANSLETGSSYNIYSWEKNWISTPTIHFDEKKLVDPVSYAKKLVNESKRYYTEFLNQK